MLHEDHSATAHRAVGDPSVGGALVPGRPGAEARTIAALLKGDVADFDQWLGSEPDVAGLVGWGAERALRAEFIIELCVATRDAATRFSRGIRIKGARIVGAIDLTTATIDALLLLERCRIEGDITLRDATSRLVNLARSRVVGSIDADRLHSNGGVYLRRGFVCEGFVRLSAATIEGDLSCKEGTILGKDGLALRGDRMHTSGSVFLNDFVAHGEVRLLDAVIDANVECIGATLANPGKIALLADNARVAGSFVLRSWKLSPDGELSFRNASTNVLQLGGLKETWPKSGTVHAQGFHYSALETDGSLTRSLCNRWLALLVPSPFSPQPYERCAQVLRELGMTNDAKHIAIQRRRTQRRQPGVPRLQRIGEWLLDVSVRYGYRPSRSIGFLLLFVTLGTMVFRSARTAGAMVPTDSSVYSNSPYKDDHKTLPAGYPPMNPIVYSLDVLLPIIDFQQDSKWRPDAKATGDLVIAGVAVSNVRIGRNALYYMWLQIAVGWILSTLLVASVTGLIRKE